MVFPRLVLSQNFCRRAGGFGVFRGRPTGICFPLIITLLAPTSQVDRAEARGAFFEEGLLTTLGRLGSTRIIFLVSCASLQPPTMMI